MVIECEGCRARGTGCGDCVVPALLECAGAGPAAGVLDIDEDERRALRVLAEHELVPPLRMVPFPPRGVTKNRRDERAS
ncbi:hypothetical protein [Actinomadura sp. SCN-SB]|uniref:hypothetical protein n=1 Tax=Actinomadura sp. SCN-SB TaxID=3373092 RepID=UPI00375323B5